MKSCHNFLLPHMALMAASVFLAGDALAFGNGQYGYSGRNNNCLSCHGEQQYDGLSVEVVAGGQEFDCWVSDGNGGLEMIKTHVMQPDETISLQLSIAPAADEDSTPQCPSHDCCATTYYYDDAGELQSEDRGDPDAAEVCVTDLGGTCTTYFAACPAPVAGFNMELVGGGAFSLNATDTEQTVQLLEVGTDDDFTQVTHTSPKTIGSEGATWILDYTGPGEDTSDDAVTFFVGANVANGNGYADGLDLNSNYLLSVPFGSSLPDYCAVCSDGSEPASDGTCENGEAATGCGCDASSQESAPAPAFLALLMLGVMGLRRRK